MYFPYTYKRYIQASLPLSVSFELNKLCTPYILKLGFQTLDDFCHCAFTNTSHPSSRVSSKTRHRIPVFLLMPRTFLFLCDIYIAIQPKTALQSQHYNENSCWDDSLHKFLSLLSNYQFEDSLLSCWCNCIPGSFVSSSMKNAFCWTQTILKSDIFLRVCRTNN